MPEPLSRDRSTLTCTCGWTGSSWAAAKDHIVAVMGTGQVHEVKAS